MEDMKRKDEAISEVDFTAEVVSGGRVTIPKWAREKLSLEDGNIIDCKIRLKLKLP